MNKRKLSHTAGRTHRLPAWTVALIAAGALTSSVHAQLQSAGELFVNVDATKLADGPVSSIANTGTLGGFFVATGTENDKPTAGTVGGTKTLIFDGTDFLQLADAASAGNIILAPAGLTGESPTRSIEVWALNPDVANEETLVSWGHRGGPDGSNVSFGYGSDFRWGAMGHWGGDGPDLGWNNDGGNPPANKWHHLVYTFDGTFSRAYADGKLANAEQVREGIINTHIDTAINLATQLEADGVTPTAGLRLTGAIARVRIHDGVLSDAQILANYNAEKADFIDPGTPPPVAPARLTKGPIHRYTFSEAAVENATGLTIKDSVGTADGTVQGEGASFSGKRLVLAGGPSATAAYGDLPNGLVSKNSVDNGGTGEFSFETWFKLTTARTWSRVFDFGSSTAADTGNEVLGPGGGGTGLDYLEYSAQIGDDVNSRRFEFRNADPEDKGTVTRDVSTQTFGQDVHVLVTWKESTGDLALYENGKQLATMNVAAKMSDLNDVNVWLGRSNWNGDQNTQGEFDEARFYDYVLTPAQALGSAQAGADNLNDHDFAASITVHPADAAGAETASASFSVSALGSSPISYQWYRDGKAIDGATGTSYTVSNISASDDGAMFTVEVSNSVNGTASKVTSNPAKLKVLPSVYELAHRYSFNEAAGTKTVKDSVGTADGTVEGTEGTGVFGGGVLALDGTDGYVNLPNGLISSLGADGTLEMWITYDGGNPWSRVFDFGTRVDGEDGTGNGLDYLFFTPKTAQGFGRFFANFPDAGDSTLLSTPGTTPVGEEFHLAISFSATANTCRVYTNGTLVATGPAGKPLSALNDDNNVWLGRSQFPSDPNFAGRYNEFRIYKGAMSPSQIAASYAAGPNSLPTAEVPVPTLTIKVEGGNLVVSWPAASTGYTLQGSASLGAGASWSNLGDGTPVTGGNFQVKVPLTGDARFLRATR